ncbi:DUF3103 family protein [Deinococcus hohokamensis]|uniref:DUF3103 family protein n=1 Tax=Deinococcus hohokamensis TaxID=309883 RepID=A0ABV9ICQ5_9DEIO
MTLSRLLPITLTVTLLLASCGQQPPTQPSFSAPTTTAAQAQTNAALHTFAMQLAQAMTEPGVRSLIAQQAALKFDGDTETLYATLASLSTGKGTFAQALASGLSAQSLSALTAQIPHLQVAVRGKAWDATTTVPLVAVAAEGGYEYAVVTAYDAQGRAHLLDSRKAPDMPVVVVGVNERVDAAGAPLPEYRLAAQHLQAQEAPQLTAQGCYNVNLHAVTIFDDMEPWTKGDAEIYVAVKGTGLLWHSRISQATDEDTYGTGNLLFGCSDSEVRFYWYEKDGSNLDFEITVGNVGFGIKIDDGNDFMGSVIVGKSYFEGSSIDYRNVGNVGQYTF